MDSAKWLERANKAYATAEAKRIELVEIRSKNKEVPQDDLDTLDNAVSVYEECRTGFENAVKQEKLQALSAEHAETRKAIEAPETRTERQLGNTGAPIVGFKDDEQELRTLAANPGIGELYIDIEKAHAYNKLVEEGVTPQEIRTWCRDFDNSPPEFRALATSDADGGQTTIPSLVARRIDPYIGAIGGLMDIARRMPTAKGEPITLSRVDTRVGTNETAEATADSATPVPASQLVLAPVVLNAHKRTARSLVSEELLEDTYTNLSEVVGDDMRDALRQKIESDLVTGSGTAAPMGLTTGTPPNVVPSGNATDIMRGNMNLLLYGLDSSLLSNASYLMSSQVYGYILRALLDSQNRPLYQAPNYLGAPSIIEGRPVVFSSAMPLAEATGNKPAANTFPVVAGDFRRGYVFRPVGGIRLRTLSERRAEEGQIVFLAKVRYDGDILNPKALRTLKVATA